MTLGMGSELLNNAPDFSGKSVLVTGASRGLGRRAAEAFAAAGAKIMLSGRDQDALSTILQALPDPDRHVIFAADLREPGRIETLIAEGQNRLGGFDVIVHALGGGFGFREPLLSAEQFAMLHQVNLGIGAEINRLAVPGMIERGGGNIVMVGSLASTEANGSVGYNSVKAALAAYTRSLGRAMAGSGVIVTCVMPGMFFAEGNSMRRLQERMPELVDKIAEDRLPRGRVGEVDELLPLLFLLAGPGASMMAGSCVAIDGGEGIAYAAL